MREGVEEYAVVREAEGVGRVSTRFRRHETSSRQAPLSEALDAPSGHNFSILISHAKLAGHLKATPFQGIKIDAKQFLN
jgi:hypothetical protein